MDSSRFLKSDLSAIFPGWQSAKPWAKSPRYALPEVMPAPPFCPRKRQSNAAPKITDATLAVCAFVRPRNDRGLMRMNSIRKRAMPVVIMYAAKM